jgi:hypothetical protein
MFIRIQTKIFNLVKNKRVGAKVKPRLTFEDCEEGGDL